MHKLGKLGKDVKIKLPKKPQETDLSPKAVSTGIQSPQWGRPILRSEHSIHVRSWLCDGNPMSLPTARAIGPGGLREETEGKPRRGYISFKDEEHNKAAKGRTSQKTPQTKCTSLAEGLILSGWSYLPPIKQELGGGGNRKERPEATLRGDGCRGWVGARNREYQTNPVLWELRKHSFINISYKLVLFLIPLKKVFLNCKHHESVLLSSSTSFAILPFAFRFPEQLDLIFVRGVQRWSRFIYFFLKEG